MQTKIACLTQQENEKFCKSAQGMWENSITEWMENEGWTKDREDETTLGFSKSGWIRDYDKTTHRFVQYDGNQIINLHTIIDRNKINHES